MDFAVGRRLGAHWLWCCSARVPPLTRLLVTAVNTLETLDVSGRRSPPLTPAICAVVRAGRLRALRLVGVRLFGGDGAASGLALLAAVTGHPTRTCVELSFNPVDEAHRAAVGAALGALAGANAPALALLDVSSCYLCDECLRPLVDALPGNARLRVLDVRFNSATKAVAASLVAAVRAYTSLTTLAANNGVGRQPPPLPDELAEAEALVAARAAAAAR